MSLRISPFSGNYFPAIGLNATTVAAATAITVLAIAILYKFVQNLLTRNTGSFPPPPNNPPLQLGPPPEVDLQDFNFLGLPLDIQKLIASYIPYSKLRSVNRHLNQVFYSSIFNLILDDCQKVFLKDEINRKCDSPDAKGKVKFVINELESLITEFRNGNDYLASINPNKSHPLTYWKMLKRYLLDTRLIHTNVYLLFIDYTKVHKIVMSSLLEMNTENFNKLLHHHAALCRGWLQSIAPTVTSLQIPFGTPLDQENWNLENITHLKIVISKSTENRCIQLFMDSLQWIPNISEITLSKAEHIGNERKTIEISSKFLLNLKTTTITTLNLQEIQIKDSDLFKKLNLKKINIFCNEPWSKNFPSQPNVTDLQLQSYGTFSTDFLTKPIFPNLVNLDMNAINIEDSQKVIQNMNVKELKLKGTFTFTPNLNFLNAFPNLTSLNLHFLIQNKRIVFNGLINLETLTIRGNCIISGLEKLKKLTSLDLDKFYKAEQDQVVQIASQLKNLKFCIDDLEYLNKEIAKKIKKISLFSRVSTSQPIIYRKVANRLKKYNHSLTMDRTG